jgi:hypothetical protein
VPSCWLQQLEQPIEALRANLSNTPTVPEEACQLFHRVVAAVERHVTVLAIES